MESMTPSPTPDPFSQLMAKVDQATNKTDGVIQQLTGFSPAPGGFSKVRWRQVEEKPLEACKAANSLIEQSAYFKVAPGALFKGSKTHTRIAAGLFVIII